LRRIFAPIAIVLLALVLPGPAAAAAPEKRQSPVGRDAQAGIRKPAALKGKRKKVEQHAGRAKSRKPAARSSAYPSRSASRAIAQREAAARDAARAAAVAEVPRSAPRQRVEAYPLAPPTRGASGG
jgi:hypothetical protein